MKDTIKRIVIAGIIVFSGCKNVARYTIDEKPVVKIDKNLLGIWKAAEDTDKNSIIFVQTSEDMINRFKSRYTNPDHDTMFQSIYDETINAHKKNKDYVYYITYLRYGGLYYQEWSTFLSKINNETFLNIGRLNGPLHGFAFVRIISTTYDKITVATVADTTLGNLNSTKEVRNRLEKNLYNPAFYKDTLHFYRVSYYHASLSEAWAESKKKLRE